MANNSAKNKEEEETGNATYSPFLFQTSEHDNYGCFLFPNHPPEVKNGLCHWAYVEKMAFLRMNKRCTINIHCLPRTLNWNY